MVHQHCPTTLEVEMKLVGAFEQAGDLVKKERPQRAEGSPQEHRKSKEKGREPEGRYESMFLVQLCGPLFFTVSQKRRGQATGP